MKLIRLKGAELDLARHPWIHFAAELERVLIS